MESVTILGATGSIGVNTLNVIRQHSTRYRVFALCANTQVDKLFEQCVEFLPKYAVVRDELLAADLADRLKKQGILDTEVIYGEQGLCFAASALEVDMVMAAIVGAAGLAPTLAAAKAGKKILLANKEVLVMAGALFMSEVASNGATVLPVDSEHNAIFQALPSGFAKGLSSVGVDRLILTASGGPFRETPLDRLQHVTPGDACAHPNWVMGKKISVDSASMMNKGLEVIEASWLFNAPPDVIDVVVHPQSIVHSMVAYCDGSVIAQMGNPDMKIPIAYSMAWPERIVSGVSPLNFFKVGRLDFFEPDFQRFPCLRLAYDALREGGTATAILNAANEVAVAAFLENKISFLGISKLIEQVLSKVEITMDVSLASVVEADFCSRNVAAELIETCA